MIRRALTFLSDTYPFFVVVLILGVVAYCSGSR